MKHNSLQKYFTLIIAALLVFTSTTAFADAEKFERLYGDLLTKYWSPAVKVQGINSTVIDYARIKLDAQNSNSLFRKTLKAIEQVNPEQLQDRNVAKAFWINAYNFAAIRLIIENYPVDSIRSLSISLFKYPWSKKAIQIGGKSYSLQQIEKEVLLKQFNDPRILFSISCAAVSCPDISSEPFVADRLNSQLDAMTRNYFSNYDKGLRLDRKKKTLTLSSVIKKDRHLFPDNERGIPDLVLRYAEPGISGWLKKNTVTIGYFKHDWTLNDLAQVD